MTRNISNLTRLTARHLPFHLAILGLISANFNGVDAHQVIFEEIGSLAGALHYHHVQLNLDIRSLSLQTDVMIKILDQYDASVKAAIPLPAGFNRSEIDQLGHSYVDGKLLADVIDQYTLQGHLEISALHRHEVSKLKARIADLLHLFPVQAKSQADKILAAETFDDALRKYLANETNHKRHKRQIWDIVNAVIGTYNGIYTRRQLNALKRELFAVEGKVDGLTKIAHANSEHILQLDNSITNIARSTLLAAANPSAVTNARFRQMLDVGQQSLDKALRALQAAQYRRLAVDFLSPDQLAALFTTLTDYARSHAKQLLVAHPSYLLQCELSYFFTGVDVVFLLHVPMAPAAAILRLMRYRPFPIPLDDSTGLMPRLERDVLAISEGSALEGTRLTMEVKFTDLMECHQINAVYLCQHHGVLQVQSNSSCLAALYSQDHDAALNLCQMNVVALDEAVLPLGNNRFLLYNDQHGYNGELDCLNERDTDLTLRKGLNTLQLQEHCTLRLRSSVIFADSAVYLEADHHAYDWEWSRSFNRPHLFENPDFVKDLAVRARQEVGTLKLLDIFQSAEMHAESARKYRILYTLIGLVAAIGLALFLTALYTYGRARILNAILRYLAIPALTYLATTSGLPRQMQRLLDRARSLQQRLDTSATPLPTTESIPPSDH